ncbi:putative NRPS-like enzyme [Xylaria bambusicola]|uniref:putative NRPS-like enzyme n=1 Tax=Xylaria bambusicola TaxID=326684 RepID=UPI0020072538|nr:putative NRPS-like enzyme [Xylaria bambusicola]KAI0526483.1 putative NRPS-like enzyme [Xylaria bambusicola]
MANISAEVVEERIRQYGRPLMIDDLIRERAKDEHQVPILGYPRYKDKPTDYELFTGKDLDRMVDEACRVLMKAGLEMNSRKTVGLFAPSDLSFVVALFAVWRLGCRALTVSIRLSELACLNLMDRTECDTLLVGSTARINATIEGLKKARSHLNFIPIPTRAEFDNPDGPSEPVVRPIQDMEAEHAELALFGHSSGSTGLPKPLSLSHRSVLNNIYFGTGCKAFNALPWYHLHGVFTSFQAMYMRKTAHLYNASLPLTSEHLVAALKEIQPEICHTVPYVLKLMAERQDGIEVLKRCKFVTSAGARTPDELGDRVVQQGVNLGVILGLTEVGHMGDSIYREPGDDSWVYIRPYANLRPHMFFKKVGEGIYEAVYLKSHPALMPSTSNSNDPPGSFHSKDLYTPHPTIENAWKYIARDDDRITLLSGEKILPVGMEGAVRESPLVRDGLMVGNDRLMPGLVLFRSTAAADLSDDEVIDAIWPLIEPANKVMDEYARITRDMITVLAADVEYPATDKNNIIRAASNSKFEDVIEKLYNKHVQTNGVLKKLNIGELEEYVFQVVRDRVGIQVPDYATDFFAAGVDSLRAAQVRRLLQQELDLDGHSLPTNVVYDAGNVANLAARLYSMRTGDQLENGHSTTGKSEIEKMEELISEFSDFTAQSPKGEVVVLTGATGALGAHVLSQLLDDPSVSRVYCLVRGDDALGRVSNSLEARGLALSKGDSKRSQKLAALSTNNFGAPQLDLRAEEYDEIRKAATLIIHAAWPVNFNISLESFKPQLAGLRNLLGLASETYSPARIVFISSISTAFNMPKPAKVPEARLESLEHAAATGYGRSKLVGERICERAGSSGLSVGVLRVGQIAADSEHGIWNKEEHVPLIVRSATEVEALPRLYGYEGRCEWMPVDTVAATLLQLAAKLEPGTAFYNITPSHAFSWNDVFLPALREAGLDFEEVELAEWLKRLRLRAEELGSAAEEKLPTIKLADYYESTYGTSFGSSESDLKYENEKACSDSIALRTCPELSSVAIVRKMLQHWLRQ